MEAQPERVSYTSQPSNHVISSPSFLNRFEPSSLFSSSAAISPQTRVFVKYSHQQELWRDRFKRQCLDRSKESRDNVINNRRNNLAFTGNGSTTHLDEDSIGKFVASEFENFWAYNELAYHRDFGDSDANIEQLIEDSLQQETQENYMDTSEYDPAIDDLIAQEEFEFRSTVDAYQNEEFGRLPSPEVETPSTFSHADIVNIPCFRCHKNNFTIDTTITFPLPAAVCLVCWFQINGLTLQRIYEIALHHSHLCSGQPLPTFDESTGLIMICNLCGLSAVF